MKWHHPAWLRAIERRLPYQIALMHSTDNGIYGKAWGFSLPPLDGTPLNSYYGTPGKPQEISCAGCYQWEEVDDLPIEWIGIIDDNLAD